MNTEAFRPTSVTIVGAGVIGLSSAWELARRGLPVRVIERGLIGDSTSRVAAGILPPAKLATAADPIDRLRGFSHQQFPDWAERLGKQTGIDIGFRACGGWYLANTPGEKAIMVGMLEYWNSLGIECQAATPDRLRESEPSLTDWLQRQPSVAAWWVPDEAQVCSPLYLKALKQACLCSGVELIERTEVENFDDCETHVEVATADQTFRSDAIVLCGGSWSGLISDALRLQQSLVPVRGQIVVLKTPVPLLGTILNLGQRYILCRDDGHTIVGSCEEEVGFQMSVTDKMIRYLHQFALDLLPELADAEVVENCAGLRPLTFDGFPMIGPIPSHPRMFVASGHFRSGIHLSPATAICLADMITKYPPPIDMDAFRVGKQQAHTA